MCTYPAWGRHVWWQYPHSEWLVLHCGSSDRQQTSWTWHADHVVFQIQQPHNPWHHSPWWIEVHHNKPCQGITRNFTWRESCCMYLMKGLDHWSSQCRTTKVQKFSLVKEFHDILPTYCESTNQLVPKRFTLGNSTQTSCCHFFSIQLEEKQNLWKEILQTMYLLYWGVLAFSFIFHETCGRSRVTTFLILLFYYWKLSVGNGWVCSNVTEWWSQLFEWLPTALTNRVWDPYRKLRT